MHSSRSFSQLSPVNPGRHLHVTTFESFAHVPPFRQVSGGHACLVWTSGKLVTKCNSVVCCGGSVILKSLKANLALTG